MSYHIYLFRKEVKEQNSDLEFLEKEERILPFTDEQFNHLRDRLLKYGYTVDTDNGYNISFNFKDGNNSIQAYLRKTNLSFISGFGDDLAEVLLTSSEFTDSGEFAKLDPQSGEWEVL